MPWRVTTARWRLNPELEFLWGLRLFTKLYVCQWREFEKERADLLDRIGRQELACAPFASLVLFDSLATVEEIARIFSNSRFKKIAPPPRLGAFTKHTKIKIGYFSADFFEHATTHLMIDLFEKHDRDAFELIAISFGPDIRDAMRLRLESAFDQFHDVRNRSDEQIVQLARQLEIDIAVDLKGYTANYRPAIFALRAAPVQVSYLGYPGPLQMAAMDYLIADPVLVPKESRAFYSEKSPTCQRPTSQTIPVAGFQKRDLPGQSLVCRSRHSCFAVSTTISSSYLACLTAG